jgi:hypothetical protein
VTLVREVGSSPAEAVSVAFKTRDDEDGRILVVARSWSNAEAGLFESLSELFGRREYGRAGGRRSAGSASSSASIPATLVPPKHDSGSVSPWSSPSSSTMRCANSNRSRRAWRRTSGPMMPCSSLGTLIRPDSVAAERVGRTVRCGSSGSRKVGGAGPVQSGSPSARPEVSSIGPSDRDRQRPGGFVGLSVCRFPTVRRQTDKNNRPTWLRPVRVSTTHSFTGPSDITSRRAVVHPTSRRPHLRPAPSRDITTFGSNSPRWNRCQEHNEIPRCNPESVNRLRKDMKRTQRVRRTAKRSSARPGQPPECDNPRSATDRPASTCCAMRTMAKVRNEPSGGLGRVCRLCSHCVSPTWARANVRNEPIEGLNG